MKEFIIKLYDRISEWDNKDKDKVVMKACPSCFRCFYGYNDVEMEKCGKCRDAKKNRTM
jgi:hypothetical protein